MCETIAVLAGTPVDSQMGVAVLARHGLAGRAIAMAADPHAQTAFQLSAPEAKEAAVGAVLREVAAQGGRRVLVYCNSLSGAVDFAPLAAATGLHIVTPLVVYRALAPRYARLGVIAANAQGLAGIERTLYAANPSLTLLGSCLLPVVCAIEDGIPAAEIVARHHLAALAEWFRACGMEALLLGCTHFPYIKDALAAGTALPLIDPAEEMVRLLMA